MESCQEQQKAAGEAHKFFDWKGCQAACFPSNTQVTVTAAIPPTAAAALADLLAQQAAQQAQKIAQQAAQQEQQQVRRRASDAPAAAAG